MIPKQEGTGARQPGVLTSEDLKRMASKGHHCSWERMPSHYVPSEGCQCLCGVSYDENWNGIIDYRGARTAGHMECKCKPKPPAPIAAPEGLEAQHHRGAASTGEQAGAKERK